MKMKFLCSNGPGLFLGTVTVGSFLRYPYKRVLSDRQKRGKLNLEDPPQQQANPLALSRLQESPCGCLRLLSPSASSGCLWTHPGAQCGLQKLGRPSTGKQRRGQKGRNQTHRKNFRTRVDRPRPGPKGCAIALLWALTPSRFPSPSCSIWVRLA